MSTPSWHEQATIFECAGDRLIGIIAQPEQPIETGVVIIVGGPQYRTGSHRQFTLLARQLAEQGIASIRFDYRGMGDSEGAFRNFEAIDEDIRAAIDTFMTQVPNLRHVALWGLCDAASAALYYGHTDPRVNSMVLLNPWVHTEAGAARARLKHYYLSRLLSKSFWAKLLSGKAQFGKSIRGLAKSAKQANFDSVGSPAPSADPRHGSAAYIDQMLSGLKAFNGNVQIVLSGEDLVAQEFEQLCKTNMNWTRACSQPKVKLSTVKNANHTFSSAAWREEAEILTLTTALSLKP